MKPLPKILLALTAVAALSLFSVQLAQAYSVTLEQVGSDVVATGSGPLDLTGLTLVVTYASLPAQIFPVLGQIVTGSGGATDGYQGSINGPTSFGGVFFTFASSGSGDSVGIFRDTSTLLVPSGYVSGNALSDSATYNNATFASLGVTPGTYVWTWGAGANQNFTLVIGVAGVPDGGTTVSLLGFGLLGLTALRRKLGC
jgi:VPDSG-CTERM motif